MSEGFEADLGPTLLSLIGIGDATPMPGRDLGDDTLQSPGRALMQYDANFAWMQGEDVVVLQPQKPPQQYRYDVASGRLLAAPLDPALAERAHAQALWGPWRTNGSGIACLERGHCNLRALLT